MKKICFIVNGFYPDFTTNGICVYKIIECLKNDFEIHVICQRYSEIDYYEKKDNINIHRIETKESKNRLKFSKLIKSKNLFKHFFGIFGLNLTRLLYWCIPLFKIKNIKKDLLNSYYNKLVDIKDLDIVVSACFPIESICALSQFKKKNKLKAIYLLFDKFSTNIGAQKNYLNMKIKFKNHLKLEHELFDICDSIIATEDWRIYLSKYHNCYNNKVTYIDIPSLVNYDNLSIESNEYLYSGLVNKKIRPVNDVLKILTNNELINFNFSFMVKGNQIKYIEKVSKKSKNIKYYGTVTMEESVSKIKSCAGLISIGNLDVSQTPSKIFEYICTGKKIIHFYYDERDRCISILKDYPLSFCMNALSFTKEDIKKLVFFLESPNLIVESSKIKDKYVKADPQYTANIIKNIYRR